MPMLIYHAQSILAPVSRQSPFSESVYDNRAQMFHICMACSECQQWEHDDINICPQQFCIKCLCGTRHSNGQLCSIALTNCTTIDAFVHC